MMRRQLLFLVFGGAIGYILGLLLGLVGIVLACAIVFAVGMYMVREELHRHGIDSNRKDSLDIGADMPFLLKPKRMQVKIRYRCLSCYAIHSRRECPRCGSKIKHAEF